jgi:hypothetical protein
MKQRLSPRYTVESPWILPLTCHVPCPLYSTRSSIEAHASACALRFFLMGLSVALIGCSGTGRLSVCIQSALEGLSTNMAPSIDPGPSMLPSD